MKPAPKTFPYKGAMRTVREICALSGLSENAVRYRINTGRGLVIPKGTRLGDGGFEYGGKRRSKESVERQRERNRAWHRTRRGTDPDAYREHMPKGLIVDGRRFESIAEAASKLGVSRCTIRRAVKIHGVGAALTRDQLFKPNGRAKPVVIDGVVYPSLAEAERKTRIPIWKIRDMMKGEDK